MKRKLRMALASLLAAACLTGAAGAASFDSSADRLSDLGLFQGTDEGYELDRAPTRAEAGVMLVRLLGAEDEALTLEYSAPFTDLEGWEAPYVQYLYDNGLTNGATETTYEPLEPCSAQMYAAFLLRALGYSDAADGDFTYAGALDFGRSIGLVDIANCSETNFLRDHVAAMSLTALHTAVKGDADTNLLEKLVDDGAVDAEAAADMLDFFASYDSYTAAVANMNKQSRMDVSVDMTADVSMSGQSVMQLSMPMEMQMAMDLDDLDQSQIAAAASMTMTVDEALVEEGEASVTDLPVSYYYTDGVYYMDMDGQKIKMALSFDEALAQMGGMDAMQSTEPICLIDSIETAGDTITITYSGEGMSALVDSMLASMGMEAEGMEMQLGDMTYTVQLKDGAVTSMQIAMQAAMEAEGVPMTMDMAMEMTVNATGDDVAVSIPDDLTGYTDLEDLMQTEA